MANTPDLHEPGACRSPSDARLPIDPWRSLAVHFGMLLGPDDFEVIDAYHRGKMWLHAAWLHREGVVWGLAPSIDAERGELRIEAGLALDARGRELHLERPACIDLGKWFAARASDETIDLERFDDGSVRLDAHVRVRFVSCLARQVPALVEPCEGSGRTTAYSRVFETVELELVPGSAPPIEPAYPRLRMLFGLDPIDAAHEDGVALEQARATILAAPIGDRPAEFERAFQRFAARDAAALLPGVDADDVPGILPVVDPAYFVLAELDGLHLRPEGEAWVYDDAALRWEQRPTHVATRPMQDLVAAAGPIGLIGSIGEVAQPGPRILRDSLVIANDRLAFEFSESVDIDSLTAERLTLSAFVPGSGWQPIAITSLTLDTTGTQVEAGYDPLPDTQTRVRVRVDGTSPAPILGVDGWPLAGADDDPPASAHDGRNFVHMQIRGA